MFFIHLELLRYITPSQLLGLLLFSFSYIHVDYIYNCFVWLLAYWWNIRRRERQRDVQDGNVGPLFNPRTLLYIEELTQQCNEHSQTFYLHPVFCQVFAPLLKGASFKIRLLRALSSKLLATANNSYLLTYLDSLRIKKETAPSSD